MVKYICSYRLDGVGSQIFGMMMAISIAERTKNTIYVHRPFERDMFIGKTALDQFDKLLGFNLTFRPWTSVPRSSLPRTITQKSYMFLRATTPIEQSRMFNNSVLKVLRKSYGKQLVGKNLLKGKRTIAVHLRRPAMPKDITGHYTWKEEQKKLMKDKSFRLISDDHMIAQLQRIQRYYKGYTINLFSTTCNHDFTRLKKACPKVNFILDGSALDAYHSMVEADILFPGCSYFSLTAAMLSRGKIHADFLQGNSIFIPKKDWALIGSKTRK